MIGAYFAGLSLSFLPYRVQIESKIASLRALGIITFYFMMGTHTRAHTHARPRNTHTHTHIHRQVCISLSVCVAERPPPSPPRAQTRARTHTRTHTGIYVHIDAEFFKNELAWSILVAFLVVCVLPMALTLLGCAAGSAVCV